LTMNIHCSMALTMNILVEYDLDNEYTLLSMTSTMNGEARQ
jgi:hypothetical protein